MSCSSTVRLTRFKFVRSRARIGSLWAALIVGCATPRATGARPTDSQGAAAPAPVVAEPREAALVRPRASGPVTVRLSVSNTDTLELSDALGRRRRVRRAGREVALDGAAARASVELSAGADGAVSIGNGAYRGRLRISVEDSGAWRVDNVVDLEDYVLGVVARELGFGDQPREAWRAQAIAARSYALANLQQRGAARRDPYLFDGVRDQAYSGEPRAANAREVASLERLREAVRSTAGLVLTEGDEFVDARYHSSCGGRTAEGRSVFPELRSSCLSSAPCEPCADAPAVQWNWTARRDELNSLARAHALGEELVSLTPRERDGSQRWITVELVGDRARKEVRFEELRRVLGRDKLRSALVQSVWPKAGEPIATGLALRGAGFGHGAGLCQRGALEHAKHGWSAERILAHYFSGARIEDRR